MKQLETKIHKEILSILNLYKAIGVDLSITQKQNKQNYEHLEHNKNCTNAKSYKLINSSISNDENKAFNNAIIAKNIQELQDVFESFDGCSLKKTATNFIKFQGNKNTDILVIDGTPSPDEDKVGNSFVSEKGKLFDKILNSIELNRDDVFIVNSIPWRPPGNRYPTEQEIKICRPFIFNLIKLVKPKIILCLGEVATNQTLNLNQSIIKSRGQWYFLKSNSYYNNSEIEDNIYVLPTLGISYLLIRPDMKKEAWEDMKLLRNKIKETILK
ncbi:uracil-DNA glycosylase [bacterium]|nr:uracil-DNA glycosylase [bacterium]